MWLVLQLTNFVDFVELQIIYACLPDILWFPNKSQHGWNNSTRVYENFPNENNSMSSEIKN